MTSSRQLSSIRLWLSVFILGLIVSGVTAFPLVHETAWLTRILGTHPFLPHGIILWVGRVSTALSEDSLHAPFLAYGTDWLAFAHLVLAIAFLGPFVDPVRNRWVVQFGVIACAAVPLLAFIAGPLRGIPILWRLIDSGFGVIGAIPLLICLKRIRQLERI